MCVISKQTVLETRTLFVPKNRTFVYPSHQLTFFLSFPVFILFSLLFLSSLEHTTESMTKTQNVSYKDTAKLGCQCIHADFKPFFYWTFPDVYLLESKMFLTLPCVYLPCVCCCLFFLWISFGLFPSWQPLSCFPTLSVLLHVYLSSVGLCQLKSVEWKNAWHCNANRKWSEHWLQQTLTIFMPAKISQRFLGHIIMTFPLHQ